MKNNDQYNEIYRRLGEGWDPSSEQLEWESSRGIKRKRLPDTVFILGGVFILLVVMTIVVNIFLWMGK